VVAQDSPKPSPGTILVVEDEPDVARALAQWVREGGWDLRTATTVHSAYRALT
jgi:CheY-like chemotaxis protein